MLVVQIFNGGALLAFHVEASLYADTALPSSRILPDNIVHIMGLFMVVQLFKLAHLFMVRNSSWRCSILWGRWDEWMLRLGWAASTHALVRLSSQMFSMVLHGIALCSQLSSQI